MRGSRYCYYDTPFGVLYLYIHIQEPAYFFFLSFSLYLLHVGWGVLQNGRNRTAVSQKRTGDKNIKANSNEMMTTLGLFLGWAPKRRIIFLYLVNKTQHERTNERWTMAEFVKSSFWSVFVLTGRRCWRRRRDWETRSVSLSVLFIYLACVSYVVPNRMLIETFFYFSFFCV